MNEIALVKQKLETHIESADKEQASIWNSIRSMGKDIATIKNNHLEHLEKDMSQVKTDIKWIKGIGGVLIIETFGVLIKLLLG